jgi:hypothetical protein
MCAGEPPSSREILLTSTKRSVRQWIAAGRPVGLVQASISVRVSLIAIVGIAATNVGFVNPRRGPAGVALP